MGTEPMGRVVVTARIENMEDLYDVKKGVKTHDQIRFVEVADAIAGLPMCTLAMPTHLIAQLGIDMLGFVKVYTPRDVRVTRTRRFGTVKLSIQGRECPTEVIESDDKETILIGRILLEAMDWAVDPKTNKLVDDRGPRRPFLYEPQPTDPNPA